MNKIRIVFDTESTEDKDILHDKLFKLLIDNGFKLTDFHILSQSFDDYMLRIFERRNLVSDMDITFTYDDEEINANKDFFRDCWERGLSAYKALFYFGDELLYQQGINPYDSIKHTNPTTIIPIYDGVSTVVVNYKVVDTKDVIELYRGTYDNCQYYKAVYCQKF